MFNRHPSISCFVYSRFSCSAEGSRHLEIQKIVKNNHFREIQQYITVIQYHAIDLWHKDEWLFPIGGLLIFFMGLPESRGFQCVHRVALGHHSELTEVPQNVPGGPYLFSQVLPPWISRGSQGVVTQVSLGKTATKDSLLHTICALYAKCHYLASKLKSEGISACGRLSFFLCCSNSRIRVILCQFVLFPSCTHSWSCVFLKDGNKNVLLVTNKISLQ